MKILILHRARLTTGPGQRLVATGRCAIRVPKRMPKFDPASPDANAETMFREGEELYTFPRDVLPVGTLTRLEQLIRNQPADDREPIDAGFTPEGDTSEKGK